MRLEVDATLAGAGGFIEAVLRQQEAFGGFDHPQVAPTRVLERLVGRRPCLDVVATHDVGEPLGQLLSRLSAAGAPLSTATSLFIARELLAVVRAVQLHRPGGFHGALTLDAIVITRDQRLIVRDHVFGRALGTVTLPPSTWWAQFGIAVPQTPGIPSFTPLTDQLQLGVIVLSTFLGRPLDHHEDLHALGALLDTVIETSIDGEEQPLGIALKSWLGRTLLVAPEGPFRSLNAASDSLEELLDAEAGYVAAPIGLDVEIPHAGVVAAVAPVVIATVVPTVVATAVPGAAPGVTPTYEPRLVIQPVVPVRPVASLAPAAPEPRSDPFAGHTFIIESNDGRSSSLIGEEEGYEPIAAPPTTPASPPDAAVLSVYGTACDAPSVETTAIRGATPAVPQEAVPVVALVPSPSATLPSAWPARPAPMAGVPPRSLAPDDDAPKPFWEFVAPGALDAHAPGAPLSFSRPVERMAAPGGDPVGATPPKGRPPAPPDPIDLVVDAPPPTFGVVTPIVTTQVSTTTSSRLRAAVEEFEQPIAPPPAPPAPLPQAAMPAAPPLALRPEPVSPPGYVPPASRQAGVHGASRETSPTYAPARRSSLGLDSVETTSAPARRSRWVVLAAVVAIVTGGGLAAAYLYVWPRDGAATVASGEPGRLRLESKPAGAIVRVNGVAKGQTPLTLPVPPGAYRIEFERGDQVRSLSTAVTSNNETYQVVTLYPTGPPGELHIVSLPNGAGVTVNGAPRGKTPLRLDGLPPGEYTVVVENGVARAEQKVEVLPEQVSAVDIPLSGTLAVSSPFPVHISDRDRPLGQLRTGSLAVGAGLRRLRLANEELGFEETREVEVAAGGVTRLVVTPPSGVLNITADIETDVYLDGRPIGLTPLTNLSVALGLHEVTFMHAQWGEQNYTVLVGLTTPSRLHVTMTVKAPKAQQRRPTPVRRRP